MAYNGWSNYETWNVKLWMDNDEGSYRYWQDRAEESLQDVDVEPDDAKTALADELQAYHEESLPELQGFAADLLGAAMSAVDWREIAESLVDDYLADNPREAVEVEEEV